MFAVWRNFSLRAGVLACLCMTASLSEYLHQVNGVHRNVQIDADWAGLTRLINYLCGVLTAEEVVGAERRISVLPATAVTWQLILTCQLFRMRVPHRVEAAACCSGSHMVRNRVMLDSNCKLLVCFLFIYIFTRCFR